LCLAVDAFCKKALKALSKCGLEEGLSASTLVLLQQATILVLTWGYFPPLRAGALCDTMAYKPSWQPSASDVDKNVMYVEDGGEKITLVLGHTKRGTLSLTKARRMSPMKYSIQSNSLGGLVLYANINLRANDAGQPLLLSSKKAKHVLSHDTWAQHYRHALEAACGVLNDDLGHVDGPILAKLLRLMAPKDQYGVRSLYAHVCSLGVQGHHETYAGLMDTSITYFYDRYIKKYKRSANKVLPENAIDSLKRVMPFLWSRPNP